MPMQARSRYYPRLADAKLLLRLKACKSLSTEARLSALHWHRHLPPSLPCQQTQSCNSKLSTYHQSSFPIAVRCNTSYYRQGSLEFVALIILLYLFRQERDELGQYPAKTFVVPRCLAIRELTAKRELSIR